MTSSGYKRGLATAAVSALAVTGLPFFAGTAHADTLNTQAGGADVVDLVTFDDTNTVSTKNDGQNTTFRLEAVGGANIAQVRFEYSLDGGATRTPIATVSRNDDGAFSTEWTPTGLNGAAMTVYAIGLGSAGATVDTDSDTADVNNAAQTVNITDGTQMGVFQAPYTGNSGNFVGVSGTSSDNTVVNLEWYTGGAFVDNGDTATPSGANHVWAAVMDITGYNYGAADQLLVSADNGATDDTEAFTLYKQQITTVSATADQTTVPAGTPANITITVKDQNGKPIAGAEVRDASQTLVGYTDGNGQVTTTQNGGASNNTYYYANATDSDPYEPELGDKKSDTVAIAQYNAAPTSLAANSKDGAAFDVDEYDADDITVQVKDQQGSNYDTTGQTLNYYWVFTPANGDAAVRTPTTGTTPQPVENNGKFVVGPPSNGFAGDGTYDLHGSLAADAGGNGAIAESKLLTVSSGDAEIVFAQAEPQQEVVGGEATVNGTLRLWNGGPGLPGRPIQVSRDGGAGNAQFNQDTGADAATYDTKTDANGDFSATLDDPATPASGENDVVTADTTPWTHNGDTDNANESASQDVNFVYSVTPGSVVVSDNGSDENGESAGEIQDFKVTVKSEDDPNTAGDQSIPLTNQQVTLTLDHGYFTDGVPQGAVGDDAGVYDNDGQSITVKTDQHGEAVFKTSIGRDEGFDDNGKVTGTITADAGSVSDTDTQMWTSEDPLNPGEVTIDFAGPSDQDSTILPKARLGQMVDLVVKAFDQFGNRVGNESVDLTDNSVHASVSPSTVTTDYDNEPDATTSADRETDQKVTASWTNDTEVLAADGADAGTAPDVTRRPERNRDRRRHDQLVRDRLRRFDLHHGRQHRW